MSLHLSKSRFCSALQCPKMLWLKQYKPAEFDDSVMNEAVLKTGLEVGDLAMGLFGPYVEVPFGDLKDMISETKRLLDEGAHINESGKNIKMLTLEEFLSFAEVDNQ